MGAQSEYPIFLRLGWLPKWFIKKSKSNMKFDFFLLNLTSYSITLSVISSGEGLGLNGFENLR